MKILLHSLATGLAVSLNLGLSSALADLEVSGSADIRATADFHGPLAAHGTWIEVESYGHCWHPSRVAVEWRPYCHGHWVWTDCGWYWVSDEPWGWACYHYGWWVHHPHHAWIWVPGIEWAPAWVSWRVGGGYVGWAPLPPPSVVVRVKAPTPPVVFVEARRFHEPITPKRVIVNDTKIIQKTTVLNNLREETKSFGGSAPRKVMFNEGPGLAKIQEATGKRAPVVSLQEAARQTPVPSGLERKISEPKDKGKPSVAEKPPVPEANPPEAKLPETPPRATPPGKDLPPEKIVPSPERPPTPAETPDKSSPPPKGKGKKGPGKDKP